MEECLKRVGDTNNSLDPFEMFDTSIYCLSNRVYEENKFEEDCLGLRELVWEKTRRLEGVYLSDFKKTVEETWQAVMADPELSVLTQADLVGCYRINNAQKEFISRLSDPSFYDFRDIFCARGRPHGDTQFEEAVVEVLTIFQNHCGSLSHKKAEMRLQSFMEPIYEHYELLKESYLMDWCRGIVGWLMSHPDANVASVHQSMLTCFDNENAASNFVTTMDFNVKEGTFTETFEFEFDASDIRQRFEAVLSSLRSQEKLRRLRSNVENGVLSLALAGATALLLPSSASWGTRAAASVAASIGLATVNGLSGEDTVQYKIDDHDFDPKEVCFARQAQ
eukprot:Blabericola_migrator_1__2460@NODE_1692_length_3988_cov_50_388166_g703_i1_p1_GENE_NODE_1692_length_3988_cov_50_388166_g703_i1NODE_1692_length_3988_cov_50_388166_g703_i1_p1_ORF_typecomplete_len336_score62_13Scm3/PF10384_9/0_35_NODE_1692_length_3988_cov_50_388166_g703_i16591666